jgi:hypothetical protein
MAIAIACTILIFPETLHHSFLSLFVTGDLGPLLAILKAQEQVLQTSPSDESEWTRLAEKVKGLRAGHVAAANGLGGQVGLLHLEISRGQIGPGELAKIFDNARALSSKAYSLASFLVSFYLFNLRQ